MTTMTMTIISRCFYDRSPRNGVYAIRKYTLYNIIMYNTYNGKNKYRVTSKRVFYAIRL